MKFYSKQSNSIIFETNNDQKLGSTSCDIWGTRAGFFSWNTLVWPKKPLQVQSFTPRFPLISLGPVLIYLIWFRYQNVGRMGFVLSHMQRPLDCFTKTGFSYLGWKLLKNQHDFLSIFPPIQRKAFVYTKGCHHDWSIFLKCYVSLIANRHKFEFFMIKNL